MEKQITLSQEQARDFYKDPEGFKKILEANFSKEQLEKKQLPKSWEELEVLRGFYVDNRSSIIQTNGVWGLFNHHHNIYATEKQAKSALTKAQLSQLMKVYNGGVELDWEDENQIKYCIIRRKNLLYVYTTFHGYEFLAFLTAELRDEFFTNFKPLIKEYFEL